MTSWRSGHHQWHCSIKHDGQNCLLLNEHFFKQRKWYFQGQGRGSVYILRVKVFTLLAHVYSHVTYSDIVHKLFLKLTSSAPGHSLSQVQLKLNRGFNSQGLPEPGACYYNCNATPTHHPPENFLSKGPSTTFHQNFCI